MILSAILEQSLFLNDVEEHKWKHHFLSIISLSAGFCASRYLCPIQKVSAITVAKIAVLSLPIVACSQMTYQFIFLGSIASISPPISTAFAAYYGLEEGRKH